MKFPEIVTMTMAELRFLKGVCQAVKMLGTDVRLKKNLFDKVNTVLQSKPVPEIAEDTAEEKKRAMAEEWALQEVNIIFTPVELVLIKSAFFSYKEFGSDDATVNALAKIYDTLGF